MFNWARTHRFSKLAWGHVKLPERPSGVLAAGMEDGGLCVWDPTKIVASAEEQVLQSVLCRAVNASDAAL
jgi:hypothetical protein